MSDLTPKAIFEQEITSRLKNNPDVASKINAIYQFDITGPNGGSWFVDLTKPGGEVGTGATANPGCTVTMSDNDFVALFTKKLNGQMAFMTGKLKIKGNMGLAMKLQQIMGG
jgi:putative sterol carrier protein